VYALSVEDDGVAPVLLAPNGESPAWSPDGSKIAYVAYASRLAETGFIVVANADGTGARRLTAGTAPESRPSWAPGGQRIAFARATAGRSEIVVRRVDRTGERAVTHARGAVDPAWRPAVVLPRASRRGCK
jgi:TolB protein